MALSNLTDWLNEFSHPSSHWYVKRLSGNDTLANGSHQAGPYIPKDVLFEVLPSLKDINAHNPKITFSVLIDSHSDVRDVTATWYNNKHRGGTRDEARVTNLGGSSSALLDPENTGALAIFAFDKSTGGDCKECRVWVCEHETEETEVEGITGPIEPGKWLFLRGDSNMLESPPHSKSCWLQADKIPLEWTIQFPSCQAIVDKTLNLRPNTNFTPDEILLKRRDCEYEMFKSVEYALYLPVIKKGFTNMDEFLSMAQTILQRRKARSGRSLELHTKAIFAEEDLKDDKHFSWGGNN